MKYLIIGLGNIGEEYAQTRHNIGFKIIDSFLEPAKFKTERYGAVGRLKYKGRILVLLKPSTFMNLSGKAVHYWMLKEKISVDHILVIADDIALPFGKIRLRAKGSDGGHNGLKNINQVIQTSDYPRMRFGVGNTFNRGQQVDYVLSNWSSEENKLLVERIELATCAIKSFCSIGIAHTMTEFNSR